MAVVLCLVYLNLLFLNQINMNLFQDVNFYFLQQIQLNYFYKLFVNVLIFLELTFLPKSK